MRQSAAADQRAVRGHGPHLPDAVGGRDSPVGEGLGRRPPHRIGVAELLDLAPGGASCTGYINKGRAGIIQPERRVTVDAPADFLHPYRDIKHPA
ncbi:hypothetical protein D3C81_1499780 [compost metagenome]